MWKTCSCDLDKVQDKQDSDMDSTEGIPVLSSDMEDGDILLGEGD